MNASNHPTSPAAPPPWYLSPERLAEFEDAVARAKHNTAIKRARAQERPSSPASRIASYRETIAQMRGMRSTEAREARRELQRFIDAEQRGEDTSEWTPPAMPCAERPRRLRRHTAQSKGGAR